MTNIHIYTFALIVLFCLTSCKTEKKDNSTILFIRDHNFGPIKYGDLNYEIYQNSFFLGETRRPSGSNRLLKKELNNDEIRKLYKLLDLINFNKIENEYVESKYDAKFYYSLTILHNDTIKDITIFQDYLPDRLKPIISYVEHISTTGVYDAINSKIIGINDASFILAVNQKEDTIRLREHDAFNLWKTLMVSDLHTEEITSIKLSDNICIPVQYPLDYIGSTINKIILQENDMFLFYHEGYVHKVNNVKIPFDISKYF